MGGLGATREPRKACKKASETRSRRGPKIEPKMGPKWEPNGDPKRRQIGAKSVTKGVKNRTLEQECSKRAQEGAKRAPGEPQRAPRGP